MRLPRKIDDRLKDAIVSIQFVPAVPLVTVLGYAHSLLKESFEAVVTDQFPSLSFNPEGVTIDQRQFYFLSKDRKFRIDIDGQSITFNLAQGYAGWTTYRTVITDCLSALQTGNLIRKINRLGVRYISQLNDIRITDSIDVQLVIKSIPEIPRSQLRLEFQQNGYHTILTLVDGYPTDGNGQATSKASFFSLVDVDIIKYYPAEQPISVDLLLSHIDTAHHEQKVLFFGLLKEDFLKTLNPEY